MAENIRGKDVTIRLAFNNAPLIVKAKTIEVNENADEITDDVNGEDRSELDIVTNYFEINLENYTPNMDVINASLAEIANQDAQNPQTRKIVVIRFTLRGGGPVAYNAKQVTRSPFNLKAGGRKEAVMTTLKLRARYFDRIQATP